MDVKEKIYKLMESRGWTTYELAERAGLTQSTVSSMFRSNITPRIPTVEKICAAFGITLAEFFTDEEVENETMTLVHQINCLSDKRKELTKALIDEFQNK